MLNIIRYYNRHFATLTVMLNIIRYYNRHFATLIIKSTLP